MAWQAAILWRTVNGNWVVEVLAEGQESQQAAYRAGLRTLEGPEVPEEVMFTLAPEDEEGAALVVAPDLTWRALLAALAPGAVTPPTTPRPRNGCPGSGSS